MEIKAELKELFALSRSHDGYASGCGYDSNDAFNITCYGETLEQLAESLAIHSPYGLDAQNWSFKKVQVILYEGNKYPHKWLAYYDKYGKGEELKSEYQTLCNLFYKDEKIVSIRNREIEEEEAEKLRERQERDAKEKAYSEEQEKKKYEKLKAKFEKP